MADRKLNVLLIIIAAALFRFLPHPPNFAPLGAMALFGGSRSENPRVAIACILGAMFLSDIFLGFDGTSPAVYGALTAITLLGFYFKSSNSISRGVVSCVCSSILFFVVTNLAVWSSGELYPRTAVGLAACFTMAIPFYWNTLFGDLVFFALLTLAYAATSRVFFRKHVTA